MCGNVLNLKSEPTAVSMCNLGEQHVILWESAAPLVSY